MRRRGKRAKRKMKRKTKDQSQRMIKSLSLRNKQIKSLNSRRPRKRKRVNRKMKKTMKDLIVEVKAKKMMESL